MILERLNETLWTALFLPLYTLCGLSLLLRCRFLPLRRFGQMWQVTLGGQEESAGAVRPGQAAGTALAATVGTGNIVGTAQAITMGGPGAVFWLWIAALLGMTVKYAEIYLGQRFHGSAMDYISAALGRTPAAAYAALSLLSTLTVGNMAQMNGAVSALCNPAGNSRFLLRLCVGLGLTLLLGLTLSGGAVRVGRLAERMVPIMAVGFLLVMGFVLFQSYRELPTAVCEIFRQAFHPRATIGAAGGLSMRQTILWGLRRGAFSNEAGLGTAANVHAEVHSSQAEKHALWGIFEVFADTIVLCTATALVILCSHADIPYGTLPGPELLQAALAKGIGEHASSVFMAAALSLFGFSTVIGCAVCGGRCAAWLLGNRGETFFRRTYLLFAFLGCIVSTRVIWIAADAVNALLSVPNLLALCIFAPQVGRVVLDAFFKSPKTKP